MRLIQKKRFLIKSISTVNHAASQEVKLNINFLIVIIRIDSDRINYWKSFCRPFQALFSLKWELERPLWRNKFILFNKQDILRYKECRVLWTAAPRHRIATETQVVEQNAEAHRTPWKYSFLELRNLVLPIEKSWFILWCHANFSHF